MHPSGRSAVFEKKNTKNNIGANLKLILQVPMEMLPVGHCLEQNLSSPQVNTVTKTLL